MGELGFAKRRRARMDVIDQMTPELRQLVNEYGNHLINQYLNMGVTKPNKIRHLIEETLNELSPIRGSNSYQGNHTGQSWPKDHDEQ